jgi:hypothetical protein
MIKKNNVVGKILKVEGGIGGPFSQSEASIFRVTQSQASFIPSQDQLT